MCKKEETTLSPMTSYLNDILAGKIPSTMSFKEYSALINSQKTPEPTHLERISQVLASLPHKNRL